jgi:hypothetical protein
VDHRRLGERLDHRVGAIAVAGQLGPQARAEKERAVPELERSTPAIRATSVPDV